MSDDPNDFKLEWRVAREELDRLRSRLTEAEGLLRECWNFGEPPVWVRRKLERFFDPARTALASPTPPTERAESRLTSAEWVVSTACRHGNHESCTLKCCACSCHPTPPKGTAP